MNQDQRVKKRSTISWYFLELRAKDLLEDEGAIVIRSTKSRSPVDIIGIFPDKKEIWLVQCKAKKELPKKPETIKRRFKELIELKGEYKVRVFLFGKHYGRYKLIEI